MTSDTAVEGTINTVLTLDEIDHENYDLETLDVNDCPISVNGGPLGADYENRYYGPNDEIKAYHEGIRHGQPYNNMPGMDISPYNTDPYTPDLATIPAATTANRIVEYFPHAQGNYSRPRDGGSTSFTRHVYENQTFTNAMLPMNRHALFRNCTFQEVLYIDCSKTSTSKQYCNNVRFENCTFNGVIVTDAPQPFNWKNNCLYFTGQATFNNQSSVREATILAPHSEPVPEHAFGFLPLPFDNLRGIWSNPARLDWCPAVSPPDAPLCVGGGSVPPAATYRVWEPFVVCRRKPNAKTCRHQESDHHRLRPDCHRPGMRIRLLGHPGVQGPSQAGV